MSAALQHHKCCNAQLYRLQRGKLVTYADQSGNRQAPLPTTEGPQLWKAVKFDVSRTGHYREWESRLNRREEANPMATTSAAVSPQSGERKDVGYE
jgi:hypothetical protein